MKYLTVEITGYYGISICAIYTQMEAKVMLVHLLKTFTLSLPDDYQLKVTQYIELIQPDGAILQCCS